MLLQQSIAILELLDALVKEVQSRAASHHLVVELADQLLVAVLDGVCDGALRDLALQLVLRFMKLIALR